MLKLNRRMSMKHTATHGTLAIEHILKSIQNKAICPDTDIISQVQNTFEEQQLHFSLT